MELEAVIPMAGKIIIRSEIYVVEDRAITHEDACTLTGLRQVRDRIYGLEPSDPGIGR